MYSNYVFLYDLKPISTHGGGSVLGAWRTRDLNTEVEDTGNLCVLAANQFTLLAGTYRCNISAPCYHSNLHQIRLYNITDVALELLGSMEYDQNGVFVQSRSFVTGRFTIAASKVFEVQYQVQTSFAATGLGVGNDWGDNIFTTVELWQETP